MPMVYRLLGPVEFSFAGQTLNAGPPKQRAVLAALLLADNQVVSVPRLVEQLWPAGPPPSAIKNIQVYVYKLRKLVGKRLSSVPCGYRLAVAPAELDVDSFRRLVAQARQARARGHLEQAVHAYRAALVLWRGPALSDLTTAGLLECAASTLEQLRVQALDERLDAELELGNHAALIPELEQLVTAHPLCERLWGHHITALHRAGRNAEAVAAYRRAARVLADELGVTPGPELAQAAQRLLGNTPGPQRTLCASCSARV